MQMLYSSLLSCYCDNHYDPIQHGERKEFIWLTEHSPWKEARADLKTRTWSQELKWRPQRTARQCVSSVLADPRPTHLPSTVGSQEDPKDMLTGQSDGGNCLIEVLPPQV